MSACKEIADALVRVNEVSFNDDEVYIEIIFPDWKAPGEGYSCGIYTTKEALDKEKIITMAREVLTANIRNSDAKVIKQDSLASRLAQVLHRIASPIERLDPEVQELLQEFERW